MFVDNGLFFACHEKTKIKIGTIGGMKAFCCSGEGFVMKFYGAFVNQTTFSVKLTYVCVQVLV